MYRNVYNRVINNSQKVGKMQIFISGRMDKHCGMSVYMEYYLAIKRSGVLIHTTTWMTLENMLSKEVIHKKSHTVWFNSYEICRIDKFKDR